MARLRGDPAFAGSGKRLRTTASRAPGARRLGLVALAALNAMGVHAIAAAEPGQRLAVYTPADVARLSIEELADLEVSSVSRRPERLADAAASVFVITRDDIRRSG